MIYLPHLDIIKSKCVQSDCKFGAVCSQLTNGGGSQCKCPDECLDYREVVDYMKSYQLHNKSNNQLMSINGQQTICGDDGNQYESICQMVKIACERRKHVSIKYVGLCGKINVKEKQINCI